MMGLKQFSYLNLGNIKTLFILSIHIYFFEKNLVKITLAEFF